MGNKEYHSLQEPFLNALRKEHETVSIFLVSGIRLVGRIESFDQYTILLKGANNITQTVFKHAISTVAPSHTVAVPPRSSESNP